MNDEKIYIFVARRSRSEETSNELWNLSVEMSCGRAAAQAAHALANLQFKTGRPLAYITTIVCEVQTQADLHKIIETLDDERVQHSAFYDTFFSDGPRYLTAIAVEPLGKTKLSMILSLIPLWSCA